MLSEILHEYGELITNPAHTLVEFTFVAMDYFIIQAVVRRWNKRRDKKHGHKEK